MKHTANPRTESYIYLITLSLIWGSSFILMKKGLLGYSPTHVASMRIFFAGVVFIPILIKQFKEIPWDKFGWILLFAILELGFPPFLYTLAQTRVDSSSAGILNSLVPLFTMLTGIILFKLRFHWLTTTGVFVGLLGAFLMTYFKSLSISHTSFDIANSYGLLIVLATFMYGLAGNILKEYLSEIPSSTLTAVAFVTLAIPAGIYLSTSNVMNIPLKEPHLSSLFYIILLSVFGSSFAIFIFSKLIQKSTALFASFVTYLIPFVSIIWGWLDGEKISIIHFLSLLIILSGIYLANLGERFAKKV